MDLKEVLFDLCSAFAVSGFEHSIADKLKSYFAKYASEIKVDPLGSVSAFVRSGKKDAPVLMLDAHMDEIGLLVTALEEGGFIRFSPLGGVDPRVLPASELEIHGKEKIPAVVCVKPPHISEKGGEFPAISNMVADTGYPLEELEKILSVGDVISFCSEPLELSNGFLSAKTIDNRAGIAVILYALEQLQKEELSADLLISITVQEEIGMRGAKTAAHAHAPDLAVVVDVSHGQTPDAPADKTYKMNGGVMIGFGPNLDRDLTSRMISLAKEKEIPHQIEVMGGNTGTNAWMIQIANESVPCALLSVPLRYMHTKSEVISFSDLKATGDLLTEFIRAYGHNREVG